MSSPIAQPQPTSIPPVNKMTCHLIDGLCEVLERGPLPSPPVPERPSLLDSRTNNSTRSCVVGWIRKGLRMIPIRCKQWSCAYCAPKLRRKFICRLKQSQCSDWAPRMMTLTLKTNGEGLLEDLKFSGKALNRFFAVLKRRFPDLKYVWVREIGSVSSMVHFHLWINRYLPQSLMSDLWRRSSEGSYIVSLNARQEAPTSYLSKYLVKSGLSAETQAILKSFRRYSSSRGLLPSPRPQTSLWKGAIFSTVCPLMDTGVRCLCILDGIYYLIGGNL